MRLIVKLEDHNMSCDQSIKAIKALLRSIGKEFRGRPNTIIARNRMESMINEALDSNYHVNVDQYEAIRNGNY
jgi:hypothetical protein